MTLYDVSIVVTASNELWPSPIMNPINAIKLIGQQNNITLSVIIIRLLCESATQNVSGILRFRRCECRWNPKTSAIFLFMTYHKKLAQKVIKRTSAASYWFITRFNLLVTYWHLLSTTWYVIHATWCRMTWNDVTSCHMTHVFLHIFVRLYNMALSGLINYLKWVWYLTQYHSMMS